MLDLSVISPQELRIAKKVVGLFGSDTTVAGILSTIEKNLAEQKEKFSTEPQRCPSCGRGYLSPLAAIEGLDRVGCRRCRYSEVV